MSNIENILIYPASGVKRRANSQQFRQELILPIRAKLNIGAAATAGVQCLPMVGYARRNFAVLTTVGAMVVTIMLIIFFGAWAVASAGDADLSSLANSAASGFAGSSYQPDSVPGAADSDNVPRLASATPASDTWWGKALLGACPLH